MAEHDVFISYAHLDNEPIRPNEPDTGWVSRFDYVLSNFLSQELGRRAKIWRDKNMDSNDYIWDTVKEHLLKSLTFVSVISPSYIKSPWCPLELNTYREKNQIRVGNKSRIFKVVKKPVKEIPEKLQDLFTEVLAVSFFEQEQSTNKTRGFFVEFGGEWEQKFYREIDLLAQEIAQLLETFQNTKPVNLPENAEPSALKPFPRKTIYMTEPSPDLWEDYVEIRRDFIKRGAKVLPSVDSTKPATIEEYEAEMRQDLKQCNLVVHFIGSEDDEYLDYGGQSLVHLQTEIAAKYQTEFDFVRLILLPQNIPLSTVQNVEPNTAPKVEPSTERRRKFIEQLSATTSRNVDLLRTPLNLRTEMERILLDQPKPQAPATVESAKPTIYVLHDNQDYESVKRLVEKLFAKGCEVWTISQSNEVQGIDLIEEHKWYLLNCDAALVYWNEAPAFRVRAMMSEFQRIMNNVRERAFRAKGIYIEGNSPDKANFITHETLIKDENHLNSFVAKIKNGGQDE